ncbi:hypothetical protein ACL02T_02850 [Pseudonocardia sp. RS010]|uniref:hypothetical protein n=1 Tax=Pseudonocardia sp. RS010 TaxID=3385979 RepID=UPI0039A001CF
MPIAALGTLGGTLADVRDRHRLVLLTSAAAAAVGDADPARGRAGSMITGRDRMRPSAAVVGPCR